AEGTTRDSWLAYYDLASGKEQLERRIPLISYPPGLRNCPVHMLHRANRSANLIRVDVTPEEILPGTVSRWLSKIPGTERLPKRHSEHVGIVIDVDAGRELMRESTP